MRAAAVNGSKRISFIGLLSRFISPNRRWSNKTAEMIQAVSEQLLTELGGCEDQASPLSKEKPEPCAGSRSYNPAFWSRNQHISFFKKKWNSPPSTRLYNELINAYYTGNYRKEADKCNESKGNSIEINSSVNNYVRCNETALSAMTINNVNKYAVSRLKCGHELTGKTIPL